MMINDPRKPVPVDHEIDSEFYLTDDVCDPSELYQEIASYEDGYLNESN